MKKLIFMFTLSLLLISAPSFGGGTNLHTDAYGNTTGTIDGERVNIHTDSYGNTTGTIGDYRINRHTDSYGNTTGR